MTAAAVHDVAAARRARHSPYQGLVPYTEADGEWFYGREEWRDVLSDNFRAYRITVLYGASGVGKSSLLRAGLIRALGDEARENTARIGSPRIVPIVFSAWSLDDPLAALKRSIAAAAREFGIADVPTGTLAEVVAGAAAGAGGALLVVLDQVEELFVYHGRRRDPTIDELAAALRRRDPAVHYLLSIREDALAALDRLEGHVPGLGEHLLRLEHLDRDAAAEAISAPLERWNRTVAAPDESVTIEPALVEAVLDEVEAGKVSLGDAGEGAVDGSGRPSGIEAPYLQLVLTRLWDEERREGSRVLRLQTLRRLGGADRIVRTHLDTALAALSPREQNLAGRTFRYLVTPSGTKIAHRVADLADYAEVPAARLEPLVDKLAGEVRVLRPAGDDRYEIYHDALAGPILDWQTRWQEGQKRRRERRKVALLVAVAAVLGLIAAGVIVLAVEFQSAKEHARDETDRAKAALSRDLARRALVELPAAPYRGFRTALAAYDQWPTPEAEGALRSALAQPRLLGQVVAKDAVLDTQFTPDGRLLVTTEGDGRTRIWRVAGLGHVADVAGPKLEVDGEVRPRSPALGRNGRLLATALDNGRVGVWRTESGAQVALLRGHLGAVTSVRFSRDGARLLSTGVDRTARLWRTGRWQRPIVLRPRGGIVWDGAFSPDGRYAVTLSADGRTRIWDARTGAPVATLAGGADVDDFQYVAFVRAAFDRTGSRLLVTAPDGLVRLWDVQDLPRARLLQTVRIPKKGSKDEVWPVNHAAFSPRGDLFATASDDQVARLFDARTGRPADQFAAKELSGAMTVVGFSMDGRRLLAGNTRARVHVWDLDSRRRVATLVVGRARSGTELAPDTAVLGVAVSPDGRTIVGGARSTRVWSAPEQVAKVVLRGTNGSFAPGGRLALTTDDGAVRIWDLDSGQLVGRVPVPRQRCPTPCAVRASFGPGGRLIAVEPRSGPATIWAPTRPGGGGSWRRVAALGSAASRSPVTAFSADGRLVAAVDGGGTATVAELGSGRTVATIVLPPNPDGSEQPERIAFRRGGTELAILRPGDLRTWAFRARGASSEADPGVREASILTTDGRAFARQAGATIELRAAARVRPFATLKADTLVRAGLSPDGSRIAIESYATTVLWTRAGDRLAMLKGTDATFSRDGTLVATTTRSDRGQRAVAHLSLAETGHEFATVAGGPDDTVVDAETGRVMAIDHRSGEARIYECQVCGPLDEILRDARNVRAPVTRR